MPGDTERGMRKGSRAEQEANKRFVTKLVTAWVIGAQFHRKALETSIEYTELFHLGLMTPGKEGDYVNSCCRLLTCSAHRRETPAATHREDAGRWTLASVHSNGKAPGDTQRH